MYRHLLKLFLFISASCYSITDNNPIGARSAAMANASVSFTDLWSSHHNQAGLGFVKNYSAGAYYENRFMIKELGLRGGCAAIPVNGGTFGIAVSNFGYSQYNENKYSLSFGKAFGEKIAFGLALDYMTTNIAEGYGKKGVAAAEAGIIAKPLNGLTIGAHVFNPTRTKIASYNDERLPTIIRFGANYTFSEKVIVAIETEKDILMKAVFKAGIEYKPVKEFYLRAGISTNPTLSSFGFGINLKNFKLDISANYHQVLGVSSQVGLSYEFQKKKSPEIKSETF